MNFLHNFDPSPIALNLGPIHIFWYGLIVVTGIIAGMITAVQLGKKYLIPAQTIFDLSFYLVIFSLLGARLYDCLLELPYYLGHPLDVFKIWQGGLAIHGAILAGLLTSYIFAKKNKLNLTALISVVVPGLALGQAIGRWGNFFNQELFGQPTNLPWGIFIDPAHRPDELIQFNYFHPTFLYESLGCLVIFCLLILLHQKLTSTKKHLTIISTYLITYSLLRFGLEFIRIDYAPTTLGLRWPQIISLAIIVITSLNLIFKNREIKNKNQEL